VTDRSRGMVEAVKKYSHKVLEIFKRVAKVKSLRIASLT